MPNATTERVKRFRNESGLIRVEVSVPNAADALAIRRFAQSRRHVPPEAARQGAGAAQEPAQAVQLAELLPTLPVDAQDALRLFVTALSRAKTPALRARARRIAENFLDIAEAQSRADEFGPSNPGDAP